MILGDRLAEALPTMRAHAESMMRTPCVARRVLGVDADASGRDVVTYSDPIYSGPCRIRNRGTVTQSMDSAAQSVTTSRLEWHVPVGVGDGIPAGAVIFIDGVPAWRVIATVEGDAQTARRYPVERVG